MICPKCGGTAMQSRRFDMLDHGAAEVVTCITCGNIIRQDEIVVGSLQDMSADFSCNQKYKRGGKRCSVDGCNKPYYAKGLCRLHYGRHRVFMRRLNSLQADYSEFTSVARQV